MKMHYYGLYFTNIRYVLTQRLSIASRFPKKHFFVSLPVFARRLSGKSNMQYWWNDTDRGTSKYSEKYCPIATLLKAELTWTVLDSHPRLELLSATFSDAVL